MVTPSISPYETDIERVVAVIRNILASSNVTPSTTVGLLPPVAVVGAGAHSFVVDATVTTFASIVASGGTNAVPVYCDGTNWRIG